MAKTGTDTSIGPNTYAVGLGIFDPGVRTVIEFQNYVAGEMTTTYFCHSAARYFDTSGPNFFIQLRFPTTSAPFTPYQGEIWIDPDVQELTIIAECTTTGGNDVELDIEVGGGALNLDAFTGAATIEDSGQILTSSSGTGWQPYTVTLTHTVGSANTCSLNRIYCGARRITASNLPDPP